MSKSKFVKGYFTAFTPEISGDNKKRIRDGIKQEVNWRNTSQGIERIGLQLNTKLRGWINYFGLFNKRELRKTILYLEWKLVEWTKRKHKKGTRWSMNFLIASDARMPKCSIIGRLECVYLYQRK